MAEPTLRSRRVAAEARAALNTSRVVLIHGPRQAGKSTLARMLARERGMDYVTLDDPDQLEAALTDPTGFVAPRGRPRVIDEVQRGGSELILALKAQVDRQPDDGQFLITGSTNFLTVPRLAESLTGRLRIVRLWPFAVGEIESGRDDFVDRVFREPDALLRSDTHVIGRNDYFERACRGGFPGAIRLGGRNRERWFDDYLDTLIQREIATAAEIRRAGALRQMARYLAAGSSNELVIGRVANDIGIDRGTADHYLGWLETAFVVHRIPAWSRNLAAKAVRRPKLFVSDSGIAASMMGKGPSALAAPTDPAGGRVIETMVVNELSKQATWSDTSVELGHLRTSDGREVDVVIEARDGRIAAIEVKASSSPRSDDFRWLVDLRDRVDAAGGLFVLGVVLHTGSARLPFGDRMIALPIADIWA